MRRDICILGEKRIHLPDFERDFQIKSDGSQEYQKCCQNYTHSSSDCCSDGLSN